MGTTLTIVAVLATVLVSQDAYAGTPLADGAVVTTSVAPTTYTFSTVNYYWSTWAVATDADYDVRLYEGETTRCSGTSDDGTGVTDWIAINSNLRPLGSYSATVSHWSGTGPFYIQQHQGHTVTTLPASANDGVTGPSDPDLAFASVNSQDVLSVSDIYLTAGQKFWVNVANTSQDFFLLESNPADPTTFIRTRAQAIGIAGTKKRSGVHDVHRELHRLARPGRGERRSAARQPSPQEGEANALVAYDPARPNTCPERNFPGPTPPGP